MAKSEPGPLKNFIAGGVGGACLVVTGHPLDTIKASSWVPEFLVDIIPAMAIAMIRK